MKHLILIITILLASAICSCHTQKQTSLSETMNATETVSGHKLRTDYSDGDPDWEAGFCMLAKTKCPAVLTENFFHDNREDVEFISSKEGIFAVVDTHVKGVMRYINSRTEARR